ncbi:MAG: CehA/McbA family metallohydrolase [Litorilinea sp.]
MNSLPFDKPGRFWRGNLHTHSDRSDGLLPPEAVCRRYQESGYDFIALTDHFLERYGHPIVDTRDFRNDEFTTLIGAELHSDMTELGGMWHLLAVGLPLDFAAGSADEPVAELAQRALQTGAFVAAAHPQWYTQTERDIATLGQVDAIEIYNGVAIDSNDRPDGWYLADIMLGRGNRFFTYAADDFHGVKDRNDFQRGWVQVRAENLTPDALLAALKQGHFYSSTGPQIHDVALTAERQLTVRCSPASRVFVTGRGPTASFVGGSGLVEAEFDLSAFNSAYCRVTVRDHLGGRAWTNPIWFEAE